jgi:hypothetical protein
MQAYLLEMIWDGHVRPLAPDDDVELAKCLNRLFPVSVAILVCSDPGVRDIAVFRDEEPLMEGASLGDVLVEELDLDLPEGTLVALVPFTLLRGAALSGAAAELAGRIALCGAEAIRRGERGRAYGAAAALWHCYESIFDLGHAEALGADLQSFLQGFNQAFARLRDGAGRAAALISGTRLPEAQIVQNGVVMRALVLQGRKVGAELFGTLTASPATAGRSRPVLRDQINISDA